MPPTRVFISYAREDFEEFLEPLVGRLSTLEREGELELWYDKRNLLPSQRWEEEIDQKVATADVGLILVSPRTWQSPVIRDREVRPILARYQAGKMLVACLYVRSIPEIDDPAFAFDTPQGKLLLTAFQGLNDPREPLANSKDRDDAIGKAVMKLLQIIRGPQRAMASSHRSGASPSDTRPELGVQILLTGDQMQRHWIGPYRNPIGQPVQERVTPGRFSSADGDALFSLLFGDSPNPLNSLLQSLLPSSPSPTPLRSPMRVRLLTNAAEVAALPWSTLSWQGSSLFSLGWTVEVTPIASSPAGWAPTLQNIQLRLPCAALVVASGSVAGAPHHAQTVTELLSRSFQHRTDAVTHVRMFSQIAAAVRSLHRPLVYLFGEAREVASGGETSITLLLRDGRGGIEAISLESIEALWRDRPPKVVMLNLTGVSKIALAATALRLSQIVPLVLTQTFDAADLGTSDGHRDPCEAARAWFQQLCSEVAQFDPISSWFRRALDHSNAYSTMERFDCAGEPIDVPAEVADLYLDRKEQRGIIQEVYRQITPAAGIHVACVVGVGTHENHPERLGAQLFDTLREVKMNESPFYQPIDLATLEGPVGVETLHRTFLTAHGCGPGTRLQQVLRKRRSQVAGQTFHFFDFGVVCRDPNNEDASQRPHWTHNEFKEWLRFCSGKLARDCPQDHRIICLLTFERPAQEHERLARAIPSLHDNLSEDERDRIRVDVLPSLDRVKESDLEVFFRGARSLCEPKQTMPRRAAKAIFALTKGHFAKTVEIVHELDRKGWSSHEVGELEGRAAQCHPPAAPTESAEF
ncbi:MAG: toll/interleukin-1 receptor domain-containing protein [Planctomycetes bacterium]|nr:toll/interleukin-1 receptor domain-containing protein [Planctomycetota bacterium]